MLSRNGEQMQVYNRKSGRIEAQEQYGGDYLRFLYNSPIGRCLLKLVINPFFSEINGVYNSSVFSKRKITSFVKKYRVNLSECKKREFTSFQDFFAREFKASARPITKDKDRLIAPADSKLLLYPIREKLKLSIKGSEYTLQELVGGRLDLSGYQKGLCMVFRLSMDDYHRYCFVDDGCIKRRMQIRGRLHTVSSISKDYKVYKENSRVVNVLETKQFGEIICIEVGALLVGKIVNHRIRSFKKGQEKGYFKLGGSTIILLFREGCVEADPDIVIANDKGMETKVQYGEGIGTGL